MLTELFSLLDTTENSIWIAKSPNLFVEKQKKWNACCLKH
uniref:Uncharacterized protein n=1 Tax=Arundo donax TaxID=35708 RepID=A0A0A9AMV8_ARUDO